MTSENTLVMTRTLPASPARVFAAWTTAETMKQWFCPGEDMTVPVAELDAREGGHYRIVMQNKNGESTYLRIRHTERETRFYLEMGGLRSRHARNH